jgi:hypothetical protein
MLRIPHCPDNQLTDGGEIVSLTCWQRSNPQKFFFHFWYLFMLEAELRLERLGKLKKIGKLDRESNP